MGVQAQDVFKEVKLESLQTLDQIYNIKELTDKLIDAETAVHVATVQGMMKRIMYAESEDRIPAVSDYDLIIIDEAHRGYILDKEMAEAEQLYRDQRDYQSKYRYVLDYFNAVKLRSPQRLPCRRQKFSASLFIPTPIARLCWMVI